MCCQGAALPADVATCPAGEGKLYYCSPRVSRLTNLATCSDFMVQSKNSESFTFMYHLASIHPLSHQMADMAGCAFPDQ